MTLEEKLNRLSLSTMSRNLGTTLSEAASRSLSPAATLEWLADVEIEARQSRERRFKCSRLQAKPSIDTSTSPTTKPVTRQSRASRTFSISAFSLAAPTWC